MKKLLLSMIVLSMGSAFAAATPQSTAMSNCINSGKTQAQCQSALQAQKLPQEKARTPNDGINFQNKQPQQQVAK